MIDNEFPSRDLDDASLAVLRNAGWSSTRVASYEQFEVGNAARGGIIVPPARRVLRSLAGLVLQPSEGSAYPLADEVASEIGNYMDVVLTAAAPDLVRRTTPLAENSGSRLFIDSEGWLWLHIMDYSLDLFGYDFESGLERLLAPKHLPDKTLRRIHLPQNLNGPDDE